MPGVHHHPLYLLADHPGEETGALETGGGDKRLAEEEGGGR